MHLVLVINIKKLKIARNAGERKSSSYVLNITFLPLHLYWYGNWYCKECCKARRSTS
jgi:hypothetical protein